MKTELSYMLDGERVVIVCNGRRELDSAIARIQRLGVRYEKKRLSNRHGGSGKRARQSATV